MTIWTLLSMFAVSGIVLTFLTERFSDAEKSRLTTFLQHFVGVWFIFSGVVKSIDPIGTALKMEEYFGYFETVLAPTWLGFLSPIFPILAKNGIIFSIFMIVLEILLGVMLVIGARRKFTAWALLVLMFFFTLLTGFTFLSGYVPEGANFFEFSKWEAFKESNMKVTDCGCFGDFLKLHPRVSFYKDLGLMLPALYFLFRNATFHVLSLRKVRTGVVAVFTVASVFFCVLNTFWTEPVVDFRPFRIGANIREGKAAEVKAASDQKILAWVLKTANGETMEVPDAEYMGNIAKYAEMQVLDRKMSELTVPRTKLSDLVVSNLQGEEVTDTLLNEKRYQFFVISSHLDATTEEKKIIVPDTIYRTDTVPVKLIAGNKDTFELKKTVEKVGQREEVFKAYTWGVRQRKQFELKINPFMEAAEKDGHLTAALVSYDAPAKIDDFRHATQAAYPFYTGDDKLVKTIMRSNPGVLLLKDGVIIHKWHFNDLPSFETIKKTMLK